MPASEDVVRLAVPSRCLEDNEIRMVQRLAELSKDFLKLRAEQFVRQRASLPLAEIVMQDATPLKTSSVHVGGDDRAKIVRKGRSGREWLVERILLLDSSSSSVVLFGEPRLMGDKTAASHYRAYVDLWGGARSKGHTGLLISHGVWDRAVQGACARLHMQRHAAWRLHHSASDAEEAESAWLFHWVTSSGCSAHDFTNALRWSNLQFFGSRQLMRAMWIIVESLRSSLDQLIAVLPRWLQLTLEFDDHAGDVDLHLLWSFLDVSEPWCDELVSLQLRFEQGKLKVAQRWSADPSVPQRVANIFMYLFEFRSWSDTRWCAVGRISRRLLSCILLGLHSIVAHVEADPHQSSYYIAGYQHMNDDIAAMIATCAVSAGASEIALKACLNDSRLPRLLPELDRLVSNERDRILSMPLSFYSMLGQVCHLSGSCLAGKCVQSVCVQLGYAENRLANLRGLPWSLVSTKPDEVIRRLNELKEGPLPEDITGQKIHTLLNVPVPMQLVAAGVELLGQVPHTTSIAEQGHVLASQLMRWHGNYTQDTLTSRTMLAGMKQLISPPHDKLAQQIRRSRAKLVRLRKKMPQKIGARQVYMGRLLKLAHEKLDRATFVGRVRGQIVRTHSSVWSSKSREDKREFQRMVPVVREEKLARQRADIEEEVHRLTELVEKERDQGSGQRSLRISDCKLSDAEKVEFDHMCSSSTWSGDHVAKLRQDAARPVLSPPAEELAILASMDWGGAEALDQPDFIGWMCEHREFFCRCVLKFRTTCRDEFFLFVFAQQNPRLICLVELQPIEVPDRVLSPSAYWLQEGEQSKHKFAIEWKWHFSNSRMFPLAENIEVLSNIRFELNGYLSCDGDWTSLQSLETFLPKKPCSKRSGGKTVELEKDFIPDAWMKHPAMWEFIKEYPEPTCKRRLRGKMGAASSSAEGGSGFLPGDAAVEALVLRRAELGDDAGEAWRQFFCWKLRGGRWTGENKGLAFDCYAAYSLKGTEAEQFVASYHSLQSSASWSIRSYGDNECLTMARAWIHRMYYFFDLWLQAPSDEVRKFGHADVSSYPEPIDFAQLAVTATGSLHNRICQIRQIVPR
jgi:hypothetical protein